MPCFVRIFQLSSPLSCLPHVHISSDQSIKIEIKEEKKKTIKSKQHSWCDSLNVHCHSLRSNYSIVNTINSSISKQAIRGGNAWSDEAPLHVYERLQIEWMCRFNSHVSFILLIVCLPLQSFAVMCIAFKMNATIWYVYVIFRAQRRVASNFRWPTAARTSTILCTHKTSAAAETNTEKKW